MQELAKSDLFFTIFKDRDEISVEEVYSLGKRDPQNKDENHKWIRRRIEIWGKRGLAEPTAGDGPQFLYNIKGFRLTPEGKKLLGRFEENPHDITETPLSLEPKA